MGFFDQWKKKEKTVEYLSDEHAAYIKDLVRRAGIVDSGRKVFGSDKHQYRLNPVITPAAVRAHEERYHFKLPEEYTFFLTKVGNGGAGPYYGIYPLAKLEHYHENIEESGKPAWIDDTLTPDRWAEKMNLLEDDDVYDQVMKEISSGFQVIGTQGCTYDNLLMVSGSETGRIVYIDWNLIPENVPFLTGMRFLEWYEGFFREIIKGNTVDSYGYIRLGTEQELIAAYENAEMKDKRSILISFCRFAKVGEETIQFLLGIDNHEVDDVRTDLLLKFDLKYGIELFETLLDGANVEAAIKCARRLPKENFDQYYDKMLHLLYHFESSREREDGCSYRDSLLFFLSDCQSLRAKDLVAFASRSDVPDDERRTAIYVMGKAKDKRSCLDHFISFMREDSLWVAHSALQAVAGVASPELVPTYEWMWDKYRHDEMMRSNLIIAFEANGIKK